MASRAGGRWEPWEGGRKWIDSDRKVAAYYIRNRIGGRRYVGAVEALRERHGRAPTADELAAALYARPDADAWWGLAVFGEEATDGQA